MPLKSYSLKKSVLSCVIYSYIHTQLVSFNCCMKLLDRENTSQTQLYSLSSNSNHVKVSFIKCKLVAQLEFLETNCHLKKKTIVYMKNNVTEEIKQQAWKCKMVCFNIFQSSLKQAWSYSWFPSTEEKIVTTLLTSCKMKGTTVLEPFCNPSCLFDFSGNDVIFKLSGKRLCI